MEIAGVFIRGKQAHGKGEIEQGKGDLMMLRITATLVTVFAFEQRRRFFRDFSHLCFSL